MDFLLSKNPEWNRVVVSCLLLRYVIRNWITISDRENQNQTHRNNVYDDRDHKGS